MPWADLPLDQTPCRLATPSLRSAACFVLPAPAELFFVSFFFFFSIFNMKKIIFNCQPSHVSPCSAVPDTAHTCRHPNDVLTKRVLFARPQRKCYRDPWCRISEILHVSKFQAQKATQNKAELTSLMKENLNFKEEPDSMIQSVRYASSRTITN